MKSHAVLMIALSAVISLVFAFIAKNTARERFRYFWILFGSFVLFSVLAGWLMYFFPR